MIHQTTTKLAGAPGMIMKGVTKSLIIDDERAESILSADITLADGERWSNLDYYDFYFSGKEAVAIGLAHELVSFRPQQEPQFVRAIWEAFE
jgi:ATP-dependent protease ClpP protease subunit